MQKSPPRISLQGKRRVKPVFLTGCVNYVVVWPGAGRACQFVSEYFIMTNVWLWSAAKAQREHGRGRRAPRWLARCLINACCQLPKCHLQICFLHSHCFNDEDYAQMSLCSWVNVVVGKMTGINRAAKYVVVSKARRVPYDYLVLCTGQKYQVRLCTFVISSFFTARGVSVTSRAVG